MLIDGLCRCGWDVGGLGYMVLGMYDDEYEYEYEYE